MQKITLVREPDSKRYMMITHLGNTIFYLGDCLADLWVESIHFYLDWANDPNEYYMSLNVAYLEKENEHILIGSQLSDQEDWGPFYKISIQEFIKLLPEWKKLVESNVQKITITDIDGKIEIVGNS